MRKIKKNDLKRDQTIFAFACPCATCVKTGKCNCVGNRYDSVSWNLVFGQLLNRDAGGSIVGGGG